MDGRKKLPTGSTATGCLLFRTEMEVQLGTHHMLLTLTSMIHVCLTGSGIHCANYVKSQDRMPDFIRNLNLYIWTFEVSLSNRNYPLRFKIFLPITLLPLIILSICLRNFLQHYVCRVSCSHRWHRL